jgi:Flp pilus assembly protein TadD
MVCGASDMSEEVESLSVLFDQAVEYTEQGRPALAMPLFRKALTLSPDHPGVLGALGDAYRKLGSHAQALDSCQRALELDPERTFARLTLARTFQEMGESQRAEAAYRTFLEAVPGDLKAWYELAGILLAQDRFREAMAAVDRVLAGAPGEPYVRMIKGFIHYNLLELEEAVRWFDAAMDLETRPGNRDLIRWNRALANLLLGRMDGEAWAARELRTVISGGSPRVFESPLWDGSPLNGRTVLLHGTGEGIGDSIMGLHYARRIRDRGGRILLECRPELLDLFATCPWVAEVAPFGGPLSAHHCHIHLMSLPHAFGTRLDTIPWDGPYLSVPGHVAHRDTLEDLTRPRDGKVSIGLVHAGVTCQKSALNRLDPARLAPLATLGDRARFFSLQKRLDPPPEPLPGVLEAVDLGDHLDTFSETAFALSRMDLLVSVDTSMVHLAGAMGRPAAAFIPHLPDWRWLAHGTRSPWYPSLRLYRQPPDRDWTGTVEALVRDLRASLEAGTFPEGLPGCST